MPLRLRPVRRRQRRQNKLRMAPLRQRKALGAGAEGVADLHADRRTRCIHRPTTRPSHVGRRSMVRIAQRAMAWTLAEAMAALTLYIRNW